MTPAGAAARWLLALLAWISPFATLAITPERIVVSVPGPRNLAYLPIDLIPRIGADREEGVKLQLLQTSGASVTLDDLASRNADFAVAGLPAAMSYRAGGGDVVAIAAVDDLPMFVLMVRAGLRGQVRRIADLQGKVVGVNTSTKNGKTTSQQLAELLLHADGVPLEAVRMVPAGQSWDAQSSLIVSGMADAIVGDEPFASRLQASRHAFFLASLADPALARRVPGTRFLHAALETRGDVLRDTPGKAEKMVRMLKKSLAWIASHPPEEVVARLGVSDAGERAALVRALRRYPRSYSRDAAFPDWQLRETESFFRAASGSDAAARVLRLGAMIDDRWVGRRP